VLRSAEFPFVTCELDALGVWEVKYSREAGRLELRKALRKLGLEITALGHGIAGDGLWYSRIILK
jgi:hypothetical protein